MDNAFEIWPRGGSDTWDNQLAGEIVTTDFFGSTSITGQIKVWLGSWIAKPVKVWLGSWVNKPVKRWNGTNWIENNY